MRQEPSNVTVLTVTASSVVANRNCIISGIALSPAAASCSVSLYEPAWFIEGTAPTTTNAVLKATLTAAAAGGTVNFPNVTGMEFKNGCVAVVAGTGAVCNVMWDLI
jgi:hypothetical protein